MFPFFWFSHVFMVVCIYVAGVFCQGVGVLHVAICAQGLNLAGRLVRSQYTYVRISRAVHNMASHSAPHRVPSVGSAATWVANPRAATSTPVGRGCGVANPTFISQSAATWNMDLRFRRVGESGGGAVGRGSFGAVFMGFDELKQEQVFIKRQRRDSPEAAKEMACYNMLESFPHPNLIRMKGMFTGQFQGKPYVYIAMECCSTTLWKFIRVDNPRRHHEFKRCGGQHQVLLDTVRAVGHLHANGITHGDVSLSNILLTAAGVVRLADFGTVTAHTYLTPQRLCVHYIRSPEALLGSEKKEPPVDAWAVSVVALALFTGRVPTSTHAMSTANPTDADVFLAVAWLLPTLTDSLWPDHHTLPRWHFYEPRLHGITENDALAQFVLKYQIPPHEECQPALTVSLVELGLQWNSQDRSSMVQMKIFLRAHFDFQLPQGCQPEQGHREQGCQPEANPPEARTAPGANKRSAGTRPELASVNFGRKVKLETKFKCACSGNCGLQPCSTRLNSRRSLTDVQICENLVDVGEKYCPSCRCDRESCTLPRSKHNRRWCTACAKTLMDSDFATSKGCGVFDETDSAMWKVVVRLNYLFQHLDPEDNVAFQEVCMAYNEPKAGSRMDPIGLVILVIVHALKWPPVVRYFSKTDVLQDLLWRRPLSHAIMSSLLVDALYDAVTWCDQKRFTNMHAVLSIAGQ